MRFCDDFFSPFPFFFLLFLSFFLFELPFFIFLLIVLGSRALRLFLMIDFEAFIEATYHLVFRSRSPVSVLYRILSCMHEIRCSVRSLSVRMYCIYPPHYLPMVQICFIVVNPVRIRLRWLMSTLYASHISVTSRLISSRYRTSYAALELQSVYKYLYGLPHSGLLVQVSLLLYTNI